MPRIAPPPFGSERDGTTPPADAPESDSRAGAPNWSPGALAELEPVTNRPSLHDRRSEAATWRRALGDGQDLHSRRLRLHFFREASTPMALLGQDGNLGLLNVDELGWPGCRWWTACRDLLLGVWTWSGLCARPPRCFGWGPLPANRDLISKITQPHGGCATGKVRPETPLARAAQGSHADRICG